jgi:N-methylhydantoinase B
MASKMVGIRLARGQRLRIESPGGGGYGPAAERDPAKIAEDVRLGYVTPESAARDYGYPLSQGRGGRG